MSIKVGPLLRKLSMLILAMFVVIALYSNRAVFAVKYDVVFSLVILHNSLTLMMGYSWSRLVNRDPAIHRTLALETGIQNSGLGLVLIFTFLDGQADMALIAAGWGVWHLIAGFLFASTFRPRKTKLAIV
jgi:BASS family bile acid:Na+ symporter